MRPRAARRPGSFRPFRGVVAGTVLSLLLAAAVRPAGAAEEGALCRESEAGALGVARSGAALSGPWIGAMTVGIGEWARAPEGAVPEAADSAGPVVIRPPGRGGPAAMPAVLPVAPARPAPASSDAAAIAPAIIYAPGAAPRAVPAAAPIAAVLQDPGPGGPPGSLLLPVAGARVTSGFGWRIHPVLGVRKFHYGVDLGAPRGTPVRAAADGVVESCGRQATPGIFVRLRHGDRVETLYAHLDRFADALRIGQAVVAGTVIAYLGSTGMSTGPHLYYELRIDGQAVDPLGSAARLPDAPAARAVAAVR